MSVLQCVWVLYKNLLNWIIPIALVTFPWWFSWKIHEYSARKKNPKFIQFGMIREQSRFSLHLEFFKWFSFNDKSKTYLYRHFKTQFEIQEYIVYLIEMKHYPKCWCAEEDLSIYIYGRCKIWGVTLANVLRIPTGSG